MNKSTTALGLDSIDRTVEIVLQRQWPRIVPRAPVPRLWQRSMEVVAVIAFAPLALAAVAALLLVFIAKLLFALVAAVFES